MSAEKGADDIITSDNEQTGSTSNNSNKEKQEAIGKKRKREKVKMNRESCSICRDGGDLLLCDNCPKSFHLDCLKLKKTDIPEGAWYCPSCQEKMDKRKENDKTEVDNEKERKRLMKNEKRRMWRLKRKSIINDSSVNVAKENFLKFANSNICLNFTYASNNDTDKTTKAISLPVLYPIPNKILKTTKRNLATLNKTLDSFGALKKIISSKCKNTNDLPLEENNEKFEGDVEDELKRVLMTPNSVKEMNEVFTKNHQLYLYNDIIRKYWNAILDKKNSRHLPKYPIDDKELYSFPDMYGIKKEKINKPEGKLITSIPQEYLSDLVQVFDFVQTFSHKLQISYFTLQELYDSLSSKSVESNTLCNEIFSSIIYVFFTHLNSMDLFEICYKIDNNTMLVKIVYDSLPEREKRNFIYSAWPELLRILITSIFFTSNEAFSEISKALQDSNCDEFNQKLTIEEKLLILKEFILVNYETDFVRATIKTEQEKRNEFRKNKRDLEEELRVTDQRKRELDRQEKFTQPQTKIEQLTKKLNTLSEDNQNLTRQQLSKLRKELEHEREQFKSVIKEIDCIEGRRVDIKNKIDKIQNEILDIPTVNKKYLGSDGRGFKYFFFPWVSSQIFIQCKSTGSHMSEKPLKYEWRSISEENDIKCLIDSLSERGIKENALMNELHKIYPKRMMPKPETSRNSYKEFTNKFYRSHNVNNYEEIASLLNSVEESITEYLTNDHKEWESFDIRNNVKAWIGAINNIDQYKNLLLMFNERTKSPYKMGIVKGNGGNIVDDEEDYSIIDAMGNLSPHKINPNLVFANKIKLWSKEFENLKLEEIYLNYISTIKSFPSLYLAIYMFKALCIDLCKRRDYYKKKNEDFDTPAPVVPEVKEKSEVSEDEESKSAGAKLYSSKLRKGNSTVSVPVANASTSNGSTNTNKKKKYIEWNETCMYCHDFGELICCEDCPNVSHISCAGLKKEPEVWRCPQCIYNLATRRMTRSTMK